MREVYKQTPVSYIEQNQSNNAFGNYYRFDMTTHFLIYVTVNSIVQLIDL